MKLNFKKSGSGPALIIQHGLFGSLDNLNGVATRLSEDFTIYQVDARNHGRSPHSSEMDYPLMAADIIEFMDSQKLATANLLGHSMGGKVMMQVALTYPERVNSLVVADIAPVTYHYRHSDIFEGLLSLDLTTIASRTEADQALQAKVPETGERQFLLRNLARSQAGNFEWRINLQGIFENYPNIIKTVDGKTPYQGETLFLKGSNSDYIKAEYKDEVLKRFPKAAVKVIANTGHWLHAEKPMTFAKLTGDFLKNAIES